MSLHELPLLAAKAAAMINNLRLDFAEMMLDLVLRHLMELVYPVPASLRAISLSTMSPHPEGPPPPAL